MADPQTDFAAAGRAGLEAMGREPWSHADVARAVLAALGNPHERVAELARWLHALDTTLYEQDGMCPNCGRVRPDGKIERCCDLGVLLVEHPGRT